MSRCYPDRVSVSVRVGPIPYPVGSAAFFGAFFDTLTVRIEGGVRGSRLPVLAALYERGTLDSDSAVVARDELAAAHAELGAHAPSAVVWDIDDPTARPPWGDDIAATITTLAEYFVTSDGRPLMTVLDTAFQASARTGLPVRIA